MPKHAFSVDGEAMPSTIFLAVTPSMRLRLSTTIEYLIALLDEIDGDENTEEQGDLEPSLGWTGTYASGNTIDLECAEVIP